MMVTFRDVHVTLHSFFYSMDNEMKKFRNYIHKNHWEDEKYTC